MAENIGDESVYLRISNLQEGKIQFTDATNAERLYREQGRNIRYTPKIARETLSVSTEKTARRGAQ